VADTQKREFSEQERRLLKLLAEESMDKIRLETEASKTILDKVRDIL